MQSLGLRGAASRQNASVSDGQYRRPITLPTRRWFCSPSYELPEALRPVIRSRAGGSGAIRRNTQSPVTGAFASDGPHPHDGLVEGLGAHGTVELCVLVAEDAPVRGHEPVAAPVGGGRHANDRLVEGDVPHRAEERGVEAERAPVGGDQPVALPPGSTYVEALD